MMYDPIYYNKKIFPIIYKNKKYLKIKIFGRINNIGVFILII